MPHFHAKYGERTAAITNAPLAQKLRDEWLFKQVAVEHGVVTFSIGYDICADVLRYYCERGQVCSQEELDEYLGARWETVEAVA